MKVAGIDVHKKVLMVVVVDASTPEGKPARRRFVTMPSELHRLLAWLQEQAVDRCANGAAQHHDRGSHEAASRRRDSTGGSTWFARGFCATNHRRGGRSGHYVRFGSRINLMGGNLSRQGRKRGAEP
jgi:hypothetical protein